MSKILFLVCLLWCMPCSAEQVYVETTGQHTLSKEETWAQAEDYAVNNALKKAIEKVGVRIDSYTEVQDRVLVHDVVQRIASAIVTIQDKQLTPVLTNGTFMIHAEVKCTVNTDSLDKVVKMFQVPSSNSLTWSDSDFGRAVKIIRIMKGK